MLRKLLVLALLALNAPVPAMAETSNEAHAYGVPLVLGTLHHDPAGQVAEWQPFASFLAGKLAQDGISEGKVIVGRDLAEMVASLKAGKVDLYIDSPFMVMAASQLAGNRIMARRWKKGMAEYESVIIARKDAGLTSLADFKGKTLAFQDERSSSGYLLAWLQLRAEGLKVERLNSQAAKPAADAVGYMFAGANMNSLAWVQYGRAAGAAMSRQQFMEDASPEQMTQLAVVLETPKIPRHLVSHRADLPPALAARIKQILLTMDQSKDGRDALAKFERTTRFDEVPAASLEALTGYAKVIHAAERER